MITIYYAQDKRISRYDMIDALLSVNDAFSQTWIADSDALFHATLPKECLITLCAGTYDTVFS